jgi:hypothetical protein
MKIDDQESLIEEVISFAGGKLKTSHALEFTVVAIDEHGRKHLLDADPRSLSGDECKTELADRLRDEFRQKDIIRYAFISECWVSRIAPMATGPVTLEYVDRHLATYHDDYQERGLSPRKGGGREEVILLHVCDRMKSQIRLWSITRDPASRFITKLTRLPDDAASTAFAGRFVNLLEGRAN